MKVLIVEDDPRNLDGLTRLVRASWKISTLKLEIVGVTTLADGLREAKDANVTILDLGLPDSEPMETIKAIPRFQPPVIVITGYDDVDISASCLKQGAAHVFVKGSAIGLIPQIFESMQKDIIRRAAARNGTENGGD